jgi:hypothetical protein
VPGVVEAAAVRVPEDADKLKVSSTFHEVQVEPFVEVLLASIYPLIGLAPPDAPLHVRVIGPSL